MRIKYVSSANAIDTKIVKIRFFRFMLYGYIDMAV